MKKIYLLRHAKASWEGETIDHQRKLKKRGIRDAELVSKEVSSKLPAPEEIFSSDAVRARDTAIIFKEAWKIGTEKFHINSQLYDFQGGNILKFLKTLDDSLQHVMLVGHNYAFTAIANLLGNEHINEIPTCGFVMLQFQTDSWSSVSKGETVLKVFPKHLKL